MKGRKDLVTPGEDLAVIEEFEGGVGTRLDKEVVRAITIGEAEYDLIHRMVKIKPRQTSSKIPKPGDIVVGRVDLVQSNIITVAIHMVNGASSNKGFSAMMLQPFELGPKSRAKKITICKPGDIIRAKVFSYANSIIHLTVDGAELGVLHAKCSVCGYRMNKVGHYLKCSECGNTEDRKLATDFGKR